MSEALVIPTNIPSRFSDDTFAGLAKAGDWLPRMQLFTAKTKECERDLIPKNHYGIVVQKDVLQDMGLEVDAVPCSWRPCAIRIGKDGVDNVFDNNSEDFKAIVAESEVQDSGCFYGLQFLLYVPAADKFVTFLFGTKSSRPEAGNMRPLIGKMATLKSRLASNTKFTWQTPVVIECSSEPSRVPTPEALAKEIEKFNNPPTKMREKAESTAETVGGREQ